MTLRYSRLNQIAGFEISEKEVTQTLLALGYKKLSNLTDTILLEIPYFRTDIDVEDDIVADILRIHNYENIKCEVMSFAPPKEITPEIYKYEDYLRKVCVEIGLHEHITDPIVAKSNQPKQVILENSVNAQKGALRTNMYDTLYSVSDNYIKNGISSAGIFEIGKTYIKNGKGDKVEDYIEHRLLQVVYFDKDQKAEDISKKTKQILATLLWNLGIKYVIKHSDKRTLAFVLDINGNEFAQLKYDSFTIHIPTLATIQTQNTRVRQDIVQLLKDDVTILIKGSDQIDHRIEDLQKIQGVKEVTTLDQYIVDEKTKAVTLRVTYTQEAKQSVKELLSTNN